MEIMIKIPKLEHFDHLIEAGLVKVKNYDELCVLKYNNKVFYENRWNEDRLLNEARGIVFDKLTGEAVIWPFTKVFNHHENGTELDLDTQVIAPRKINGFMASARWYHDELLISTTGTLDSEYVAMARKHIEKLNTGSFMDSFTYLFEIVDVTDPHIVEEKEGAWLIGMRNMQAGWMASEGFLDLEALQINALRPEVIKATFKDVLLATLECQHEGFMVRLAGSQETVMKLKSPHYLSKKFLMRMGQKKVDQMFDDKEEFIKTIDEEFYRVVHWITRWHSKEDWKGLSDVQRRERIEGYFDNLRGE